MSKLDHKIALQSAMLSGQRQRIAQRKQSLQLGAVAICKRPSTFACATLAGFVLARTAPAAFIGVLGRTASASGTPVTGGLAGTLRVVLLSVAPAVINWAITTGFASRDRALRQQP